MCVKEKTNLGGSIESFSGRKLQGGEKGRGLGWIGEKGGGEDLWWVWKRRVRETGEVREGRALTKGAGLGSDRAVGPAR